MIALRAYRQLEDAWTGGVADWCRAASAVVLAGGQAWMIVTGDGHANWIKRRLLCEGVSLFGVQFLDARALRREVCLRRGIAPPTLGRHALELLLRLYALTHENDRPELAAVARHPGACLAALDEYAAAGWLEDGPGLFAELLPAALHDWLPLLRATGSWVPALDREALRAVEAAPPPAGLRPLTVCAWGWDAACWPLFDLLVTTAKMATAAAIYSPSPRGTSEAVQQQWLTALEERLGGSFDHCESSDFESAQAALAARLEGADLGGGPDVPLPLAPELLAGYDAVDTALLARDFVARWLAAHPVGKAGREARDGGQRLVILCPARDVSSVALVKALAAADIAVEDEVGEQPEPALSIQIQRAIIAYYQDEADIEAFCALVELLNEHRALTDSEAVTGPRGMFPLDPVEVRRALHGAFADFQHHSVRVLGESAGLARAEVARPLRALIEHLGVWPEALPWRDILRRWEGCLNGFGLTTALLEPLWSQLAALPIEEPVPPPAFFQFLGGILAGVPPRRAAAGMNRFARIVVTSLEGATGQTWGGALFLDSNEGAWPIYPGENSFLDDTARARLNVRRAACSEDGGGLPPDRGYLLTASDRAQLEHFRFLEILENCAGPLAFAGVAHDPAEPSKELYANEWALRCLVEGGQAPAAGENLLDRWRRAVRRTRRALRPLARKEAAHLEEIFARRRDPETPFDAYFLNFSALAAPDELFSTEAWSGRDLEAAWNRPATFALRAIFGVEPWREGSGGLHRRENWVVGRLVHRWLGLALDASREPRRMTAADWQRALDTGLSRARGATERSLLGTLALPATSSPHAAPALPAWWQSTLGKAEWATRRCLEALAQTAKSPDANGEIPASRWLSLEKPFRADLKTPAGALRLRARCDVALLDGPTLAGAVGQLIDIRTGAPPSAGPPTANQLESGQGFSQGALLLLAESEGADPVGLQVGVIHPDTAYVAQFTADALPALEPVFGQLAARQQSLVFGQKGALTGGHSRDDREELPLATTPVSLAVLAAKAKLTP